MGNSIHKYHSDIIKGKTTFEAQIAHHLHQIELHKDTNAYVNVFADEALYQAKELDVAMASGKLLMRKLTGVAISLKDNICYKGHPCSAGSKILEGYNSPYSATAVDRLVNEGAIIIGTTNCDQFGMGSASTNSHYGSVRNAANTDLIAGGSSGGAAVSVQIDSCMIALGSDTGGSVRQPAAFTSTIGFKPSYGGISRHGLIAYGSSFDQIGIIAHSYENIRLVFDLMRGKDTYDSTSIDVLPLGEGLPRRPKLAYIPSMFEGEGAWMDANKAALAKTGENAELKAYDFDLMKYLVPTYYILCTAEASSNLSRFDGVRYGHRSEHSDSLQEMYINSRSEGFGTEVKKRIMIGTFVLSEGYFDAYFTKAQKVRQLVRNRITAILAENDGLIMPISTSGPWELDAKITDPTQVYLSDVYTVLANLVGMPAITLPFKEINTSSPIGLSLQIMAKQKNDLQLFNLASASGN